MHSNEMSLVTEIDRDGAPLGSSAVTPWWSFTKTLIAAATMRLVERRKVSVDSDLDGIGASPRALLQHRAGLPDYGWLPTYHEAVRRGDDPWPEDTMLAALPPSFAAGNFSYSNVGYLHLRRLIERATNAPFAMALQDLVLVPLGLSARVAYDRAAMAACVNPADLIYHPGWVYHGLVVGTATDAALALRRILASDFLAPSSRAAMQLARPVAVPTVGRPWSTTGYGLGLMMGTMAAGPQRIAVAGHSAGGPGSAGAVYHAASRTVAVFTADPSEAPAEHEVCKRLAQG
ncbi:MAG: beta-lactamase family protein [Rhodospirillales bacterium]|nr:beta-lactamase family protein [Rhodospirillales bacterium]